MKMRKLLAVFLSLMLSGSLAACGGQEQKTPAADAQGEEPSEQKEGDSAAEDIAGEGDQDAEGTEAGMGELSDEPSDDTGKKVELKFYEHADNEKIAQELVDAYNAQSENVKVSLSIIANDDYDDKVKVLLSGGGNVDCFWVRGGPEMRLLANNGALLSLEEMVQADGIDTSVYGDIAASFAASGETYGLCFNKSCWLLFYNQDLFDEVGLDYPINLNWDEYSDLAASLKTDELWGGVVPDWTMNLGASSMGEYLTDEDLTKTIEYARHMERWYVTDHSHPSIEEMTGSFGLSAFYAEGKTYMMLNGDWAFQTFPGYDPQFTWCAAPLPVFEGVDAESTVGTASCLSIAANSAHPEEAFDFIKFCCYSEEGAKILAANSAVSAYPSDEAVEIYRDIVTVPGVEYVFSANVGMEKGLEDHYDELNEAYNEEISSSLVGNCTLEEAFETFKTRREEILNR